jgi:hypothetical protein
MPVWLKIDEGHGAIVLVGGQEHQATVTGPLLRPLGRPRLGSPGTHLRGRVVRDGHLPDRAEEYVSYVGGVTRFVRTDRDVHPASVLAARRPAIRSPPTAPPAPRQCPPGSRPEEFRLGPKR